MRTRRFPLSLVAGSALVLLAIAAFLSTHERITEEVTVGFQGPARRNPYLALERLLEEEEITCFSPYGGLEALPPETGTLLLFAPREGFAEAQVEALTGWVFRGGHLVTCPAESPADPLLDRIGVSVHGRAQGSELSGAERALHGSALEELKATRRTTTSVELFGQKVDVERDKGVGLAGPHRSPEGTEPCLRDMPVLSFKQGKGDVTVLMDPGVLTNGRIGNAGHAQLALLLASGPAEESRDVKGSEAADVWIVRKDRAPSLLTWLFRRAGPALVSFLILIAAVLFHLGPRFGPMVSEPPAGRRSLIEHFDGAGEYIYRTEGSAPLLPAPRAAVLARLSLVEPSSASAPPREMVRRLSALSGVPAHRVDKALYGEPPEKPEEFLQTIRTLETLRRSL